MPCFRPLRGWRSKAVNDSGKRSIVFKRQHGFDDLELEVPCGQCVGCRLERSRQWAIRCVHEASLYDQNCFITLTYDDEHLPSSGSLDVRHFQLFMKRLRKRFGSGIRFFHCGEYGEQLRRPHYHACLFNFDFPDKKLWKISEGNRLYTSAILHSGEVSDLWPFGYCIIGDVTFQSAAYVARYIMKKITGENQDEHYQGIKPEYITMSRRPGIGKGWFDKYKGDVFPGDYVVMNGKKVFVPKFYDGLLEHDNKNLHTELKGNRLKNALKHSDNNTLRRLRDREQVKNAQTRTLFRKYESED